MDDMCTTYAFVKEFIWLKIKGMQDWSMNYYSESFSYFIMIKLYIEFAIKCKEYSWK